MRKVLVDFAPLLTAFNRVKFWSKVQLAAGGCWKWKYKSPKSNAGGVFRPQDGTPVSARRFAWVMAGGDPLTRFVGVFCGDSQCVRPSHLHDWGKDVLRFQWRKFVDYQIAQKYGIAPHLRSDLRERVQAEMTKAHIYPPNGLRRGDLECLVVDMKPAAAAAQEEIVASERVCAV